MPLPPHIENRPELEAGLDFYWDAFWAISSCRPQGLGPIEWTAIDSYARRYRITGYEFERLVLIVNNMDAAFLNHNSEKAGVARKKAIGGQAKKPLGGRLKMKK
jgi:hypothetical protein